MKTVEEVTKLLNVKYGKGTIENTVDFERAEVEFISTNSFNLDYLFGGGVPSGRIIEVLGEESSGKSTLALYIAAQFQKQKKKVVFLDPEYAFSASYAKSIGVDVNKLLISQTSSGEETFDVAENLIKTGDIDLIIIDSVAALLPDAEMEKEISQQTIALTARLMSKGLRRIVGLASINKTTILFINQTRSKIGVYWGEKEISSGGKALKFYASCRIKVRKGKKIKNKSEEIIGNWLEMKMVKNKVSAPFKESSIEIIFGHGIDLAGDLLDHAEKHKVVKKEGNTYMFGKEKIGVSRDKAKEKLTEDKELFSKIKKALDTVLKTS